MIKLHPVLNDVKHVIKHTKDVKKKVLLRPQVPFKI